MTYHLSDLYRKVYQMSFIIAPLAHVAELQDTRDITKMLGIIEFDPRAAYSKTSKSINTLILVSDHENYVDETSPSVTTIERILAFGASIKTTDAVLIHCFAGISRSTAAALIIFYSIVKDADLAAEYVLKCQPLAAPNRVIVSLADSFLRADGQLNRVAKEMNEKRG